MNILYLKYKTALIILMFNSTPAVVKNIDPFLYSFKTDTNVLIKTIRKNRKETNMKKNQDQILKGLSVEKHIDSGMTKMQALEKYHTECKSPKSSSNK